MSLFDFCCHNFVDAVISEILPELVDFLFPVSSFMLGTIQGDTVCEPFHDIQGSNQRQWERVEQYITPDGENLDCDKIPIFKRLPNLTT